MVVRGNFKIFVDGSHKFISPVVSSLSHSVYFHTHLLRITTDREWAKLWYDQCFQADLWKMVDEVVEYYPALSSAPHSDIRSSFSLLIGWLKYCGWFVPEHNRGCGTGGCAPSLDLGCVPALVTPWQIVQSKD